MTIQIDDAGWGSLMGGVLIGACREELPRTQHAFREVPAGAFQGSAFESKAYLHLAADAAMELLEELRVPLDEPVRVCTGYVLRLVQPRLADNGYLSSPAKIGDPLQALIEREFLDRVLALGVETDFETMTEKQGLYFWQCVRWLKGGDVEAADVIAARAQHCKTGWSTYRIWAFNPYSEAKSKAKAYKREKARARRPGW